jgi:hypothetical protein
MVVEHGRRGLTRAQEVGIAGSPSVAEGQVPLAATFGARTMTGCQSRSFIEEKELRVPAGRHYGPLSAFELELTEKPPLDVPGSSDLASFVVQEASIAHERASLRSGDDRAEWGHSVLARHERQLEGRWIE